MRHLVRWVLVIVLCPLLGAMVLRGLIARVSEDPSCDVWGWTGGLIIGLAYAAGLLGLVLAPAGTRSRAAGDLVLLALSAVALADIISQLSRTSWPWVWHLTGVVYVLGLGIVLRRLRLAMRRAPGPNTRGRR